ncbi:DUF1566 domain-containing protein [bacterium]|nr:DUF1566 domain-containing protein [bacterium]
MKKFCVLAAISAAMFLMISCGGSSDGESCYTDDSNDCNGKTVKICGSGSSSYYEVDGKKFACDASGCENAARELTKYCDSASNNTPAEPDDPTNPENNNPAESGDTESKIPECDPTTAHTYGYPSCKESGLLWSLQANDAMDWDEAVSYCDNLNASGFDDWRLPTISELRKLIQNCSETVSGGLCGVSDDCLSDECWSEAMCVYCPDVDSPDFDQENRSPLNDFYSILGDDMAAFWSSSSNGKDDERWVADFRNASIYTSVTTTGKSVRCVRSAE